MPRYRPGYSRSTVSSRTGAVSETSIVFSSSGGHSHDGLNSSLIDTTKYSVWDFPVNTVYSTTPRASRQNAHIDQFRNFITSHVADNVLGPAGVTLRDNIISANNIIAGSINSNLIAANTIVAGNIAANTITTDLLATDAITSLNYSYTSGDYSDAGTFFNLSDGSITSAQFAIDSSGNASFAGDISGASGTFTGDLSGSNISGGTIDIGGSDSTSFHVDSSGNMWLGASTYAGAASKFRVSSAGVLTASSATITGTINATGGYIGNNTYGFRFQNVSGSYSRLYSLDNTGSAASRGNIDIRSYGDVFIYSTPTSGGHANQSWKTSLVGEWVHVERTDGTTYRHTALLGQWYGGNAGPSMELRYNNSTKVLASAQSTHGTLELWNSSATRTINISGSGGTIEASGSISATSVTTSSGVTSYGRSIFRYVNDVSLSGVSGSIIIGGDGSGNHIAIDNNEIMAKANGTTAATLNLNVDGGDVVLGGRLKAQESTGYSTSWSTQQIQSIGSGNAGIAIRAGTNTGTVQLRVGYNYPVLYVRNHDDSANAPIQAGNINVEQITSTTTYNTPNGTSGRNVFVLSSGVFGYYSSSIKTKKNIEPIHYGLSDVMAINPVSFEYIKNEGERHIGMIEEELREIVPEACVYDEDDPDFISSINYSHLTSVLIKAIQDLKNEVDELRSEISNFSN